MSSDIEVSRYEAVVCKYQTQIIIAIALITGGFLLYLNRNLWFYGDDYSVIFDRYFQVQNGNLIDAVLKPHNEHPVVIPSLVYLGIESVFGLKHYWIFVLPVLIMHCVIVGSIGFLLSKILNSVYLVLAGTSAVAFLSAGAENLFWAFQFGFIGAIAFGFLHLTLVYNRNSVNWRDYVGSLLAIFAVLNPGTALTSLFLVGSYLILSKRWKATAIALSPAVLVLLTWRMLYGSEENHPKPSLSQLLDLHRYVWKGLTTTGDGLLHLNGTAVVILVAIVAFFVMRFKRTPEHLVALACLSSWTFFYLVNGFGRIQYGIDQAGSSRYTYVGVALVVIPFFIVLDSILRSRVALRFTGLAIIFWSVLIGGMELAQHARSREVSDRERYSNMSAAIELSYTHDVKLDAIPSPALDANVSVADLLQAEEEQLWPQRSYRRRNLIDTANRVSMIVAPTDSSELISNHILSGFINVQEPSLDNDCLRFVPYAAPQIVIRTTSDDVFLLKSDYDAILGLSIQTPRGLRSIEVGHSLISNQTYAISGWLPDSEIVINLPSNTPVTFCGIKQL